MSGPSQHERLVIDRHRGNAVPVSTTDPREAQADMDREARRIIANPLLALDDVVALRELDPATRERIAAGLKAIQLDARERADKAWVKHKGPMAAYWKAVGVYAGHLGRVLRS